MGDGWGECLQAKGTGILVGISMGVDVRGTEFARASTGVCVRGYLGEVSADSELVVWGDFMP